MDARQLAKNTAVLVSAALTLPEEVDDEARESFANAIVKVLTGPIAEKCRDEGLDPNEVIDSAFETVCKEIEQEEP